MFSSSSRNLSSYIASHKLASNWGRISAELNRGLVRVKTAVKDVGVRLKGDGGGGWGKKNTIFSYDNRGNSNNVSVILFS